MCGIIGVSGSSDPLSLLLEGLARLEYRGYDSAGVALSDEGAVWRTRAAVATSSLSSLAETVLTSAAPEGAQTGIGHTRWATHGAPTEPNAHPHVDCTEKIALVHNGIIENYRELGDPLYAAGHVRNSDTDTEVVAHLVEAEIASGAGLAEALRRVCSRVRGAFAIAAVNTDEPDLIVAARRTSPLIIGRSGETGFVGSDVSALLGLADEIWQLEDDEVAEICRGQVSVTNLDGNPVVPERLSVSWDAEAAQKDGYASFMSKEIHEQPRALAATLLGRFPAAGAAPSAVGAGAVGAGAEGADVVGDGAGDGAAPLPPVVIDELALDAETLAGIERVVLVACGSSYHASLVARHALESWARMPAEVDIASEFRYRDAVLGDRTLVVAVSQSGESIDTYHAMTEGRRLGARAISLTNVVDSLMARKADGVLYTRAGPEIGVASTKCHLAQIALLETFALHMAAVRGTLPPAEIAALGDQLLGTSELVASMIAREHDYRRVAKEFMATEDFFFLGRHIGYPIALEGALKLKELAYVRAEAYPAGEMKHGPIALIEPGAVVLAVALRGPMFEKVMANVAEARARGATILLLADEHDDEAAEQADALMTVPHTAPIISPLVAVVPLQIFAEEVATLRGYNVDRPRNLAKVVTVE
jgi:glucosamine--fructose-6-phosphate aminotransferase (isomerizing)